MEFKKVAWSNWGSWLSREAGGLVKAWKSVWRGAERFLNRWKWAALCLTALVLTAAWLIHPLDQRWTSKVRKMREMRLVKNVKYPKAPPRPRKFEHWSGQYGILGEVQPRLPDSHKPGEVTTKMPEKPGKRPAKDRGLVRLSEQLSFWGDVTQYNLALFGAFWLAGLLRKSRRIRRMAVCIVMGTTLAGVVTNEFRYCLGRPRPKEVLSKRVQDQFTGMANTMHYQSFPSSHCATVFGAAVPLLILAPALGIPAVLFAGSVAWARMYSRNHYPTDVIVGSFAGIFFGAICALPLKGKIRRARRLTGRRLETPQPLPA